MVERFVSFMGWTEEEWSAVRQWAQNKGRELPDYPELKGGQLVGDLGPWRQIQHEWLQRGYPDHPSLGEVIQGKWP